MNLQILIQRIRELERNLADEGAVGIDRLILADVRATLADLALRLSSAGLGSEGGRVQTLGYARPRIRRRGTM